jgi:hypothetical protein
MEKPSGSWTVREFRHLEATRDQFGLRDVVNAHTVFGGDSPSDRGYSVDSLSRARVTRIVGEARILQCEAKHGRRAWQPQDCGAHPSVLVANNAEEATLNSGDRRALLRVPML